MEIVYPVHLSPVVRSTAEELLGGVPNIRLIAPLDAVDMHRLMARSYMVMTDSGGIQEEAPALGKPVLVLRRETERPEAVTAGTVKLAGTDTEDIYRLAAELLDNPAAYDRMAKAVNPYGDGKACPRIAQAILSHFLPNVQPPEPFVPRALKKQHPPRMNSSSLSPLSRYMRYSTRISSRSSLSRSASEKFLQQLLQAAAGQARRRACFPADGAGGRGRISGCGASGTRSTRPLLPLIAIIHGRPPLSPRRRARQATRAARASWRGRSCAGAFSQIGLHGLEQVAIGGVMPAAAQRRHHPAQLPHVEVSSGSGADGGADLSPPSPRIEDANCAILPNCFGSLSSASSFPPISSILHRVLYFFRPDAARCPC